jgi:hypothetical protein
MTVNPDIDNVATPERIAIIANIVIVFIGFRCAAKTIYDNINELVHMTPALRRVARRTARRTTRRRVV